jgi:hypothetical protein
MTLEKITCLDCGTDMEKSGTSVMLRCGPCGVRYRAAVTERRREDRMKVKRQGTLKYKGIETPMAVLVEDLSFHGARIRYSGDIAFFFKRRTFRDSIFTLDIEKLELHTFIKIVWTTQINDEKSMAGLRFI